MHLFFTTTKNDLVVSHPATEFYPAWTVIIVSISL